MMGCWLMSCMALHMHMVLFNSARQCPFLLLRKVPLCWLAYLSVIKINVMQLSVVYCTYLSIVKGISVLCSVPLCCKVYLSIGLLASLLCGV